MQVQAAVVNELGSDFSIEDVELGDPGPGEVLVQIAAAGLCHTDLAVQHGHLPFPLPGVFGHEGAGTVVSIGDGVTKVAPGDKVALTFNSCGDCPSCAKGEPAYCHDFLARNLGGVRPDGTSPISKGGTEIGGNFFGQSSFATHSIATERNVVKLPDDADLVAAAPLGCGVQTGAGAVLNSMDCQPGTSLLVLGGGSVGLSAVMAGKVRDLATIIVVEPQAGRRDLALELGATHAVDPVAGPLTDQIRAILPGGVDAVVETTGNLDVMGAALGALAHRGTFGIIGVPADPNAALPVPIMLAQVLGARIIGIVEGDSNPDEFIPQLAKLNQEGKFPYDKLITTLPFTGINDAIAAQARGEAVKVVLVHD